MSTSRRPLKRARAESTSRSDRTMKDRSMTQDRELSDSERVDMLRRTFFQSALPDLPKIDGFHVCWLTTQNPRDPIHGRMRLGYELIQAVDIPGFEHLGIKDGSYKGAIGVNEMVAAKLPIHLYEAFMREVHFDAPLREEESIYNDALQVGEQAAQAAKRGGSMRAPIIEEGTRELGQPRDAPSFSTDEY